MLRIEEKEGKRVIIVPKGIRFISDWSEYNLNDFKFQHILDKKIPGCGYTEYCIRNDMNIILCSPRKILLDNKEEQHPNEVFYFKNELDKDVRYDKDISNKEKLDKDLDKTEIKSKSEKEKKDIIDNLHSQLINYVRSCFFKAKPIKILVTYDSFRLVKQFLMEDNMFDIFYTVVDEFQSVLVDSTFKSDIELDFMNQLNGIDKVCFVSATPMIDKYLKSIPIFASLPYYELDWKKDDPLRVIKPLLKVRVTHSVVSSAKEIINTYLDGKFKKTYVKDEEGNLITIESREAVLYLNSVNNITDIINRTKLSPDQVNILCSNTPENKKKIETRLGKGWSIGKVPLEHEPNKMFTFCTRTVYLGADMYSNCARTFIFSDANIETLMVDISLDLPQIMGRQRNLDNPWRNKAEFYYKTLKNKNITFKEVFDKLREKKMKKTENLLLSYKITPTDEAKFDLAEKYEVAIQVENYRSDYVAVNKHSGNTLIPCINHLVLVSEERAFDIQQIDYKDRFTVFNTVVNKEMLDDDVTSNIKNFLTKFESLKIFYDKMKLLCESGLEEEEISVILDQIPLTYKDFYTTLGPDRCRANGYHLTEIKNEFEATYLKDLDSLKSKILSEFKVGERYLKSEIKEKLREIYTSESYAKTPKATDLENYFEVKSCLISKDGRKSNGFEILKKK